MRGIKEGRSSSSKLLFCIIIFKYFYCYCIVTMTLDDTPGYFVVVLDVARL